MNKTVEYIKNADTGIVKTVENGTKDLIRYGMQIAMLNRLLSNNMITEKEHKKVIIQLKADYKAFFV